MNDYTYLLYGCTGDGKECVAVFKSLGDVEKELDEHIDTLEYYIFPFYSLYEVKLNDMWGGTGKERRHIRDYYPGKVPEQFKNELEAMKL